jgi:hypothetical protein
MILSDELFSAYIQCPLKCFKEFKGETSQGNSYAEWLSSNRYAFIIRTLRSISSKYNVSDVVDAANMLVDFNHAEWRLLSNALVRTKHLECNISAIEKVASEHCPKPGLCLNMPDNYAEFIPTI